MSTYDSLDAYNADIEAARNAYASDEAARAGLCAVCQSAKRHGHHRRCWRCHTNKIQETA